MSDGKTGWERERRAHFDEIVERYDRTRPSFPGEMFADILEYAGSPSAGRALEIGPGTGKATAPILNAGYDVTAVEISPNMAAFLRERFGGNPRLHLIEGAFEEVPLGEGEYDLLWAASAFHWIDPEIGCPKARRALKDGGAFALLRYNFNIFPADDEPLGAQLRAVYERHYYDHYASAGRPIRITRELLETPEKIRSGFGFADMRAYGFTDVTMRLYDATLTYTPDGYAEHLDTLSDHRALPEGDREALYAAVRDVIAANGGRHDIHCIFQLYMGRKA